MANEIILYQPNETVRLEVRLEDETVWLTQAQIVELFKSSKANVSEHIKNIFSIGELDETATVRKIRTVRKEGIRNVSRMIESAYPARTNRDVRLEYPQGESHQIASRGQEDCPSAGEFARRAVRRSG